jgi:hypothetical protein
MRLPPGNLLRFNTLAPQNSRISHVKARKLCAPAQLRDFFVAAERTYTTTPLAERVARAWYG